MYGGAARGGKSYALLAAAVQYVHVAGYRALLLRRSYADLNLPEALIPMSHQWFAGKADWNGQHNEWTFPSGATLTFGYLQTEIDKYRYQGATLQFIGFDELTQFTESQYRYLFSRLSPNPSVAVPLRMRSASNPGNHGHEWVKKRFLKTVKPGRNFISAKLEDNPHVDTEAYNASLLELDPVARRQLRFGDWDIVSDGVFKRAWFRYWRREGEFYRLMGATDRLVLIEDCTRFLIADVAGTEKRKKGHDPDYSVSQVYDLTPTGDLILVDQWRAQVQTTETEEAIFRQIGRYEIPYIGVEHAHVGIGVIQHLRRRGIAVRGISARGKGKLVRSQSAQIRMEAGTVYFPADATWVPDELEPELLSFTGTGEDAHDDQADCVSYAAIHAQKIAGAIKRKPDEDLHEQRAKREHEIKEDDNRSREQMREAALESAAASRRGEGAFVPFNDDDD